MARPKNVIDRDKVWVALTPAQQNAVKDMVRHTSGELNGPVKIEIGTDWYTDAYAKDLCIILTEDGLTMHGWINTEGNLIGDWC